MKFMQEIHPSNHPEIQGGVLEKMVTSMLHPFMWHEFNSQAIDLPEKSIAGSRESRFSVTRFF